MALHSDAPIRTTRGWFARGTAAALVAVCAVTTGAGVGLPSAQAAGGYQAPIISGNDWPSGVFTPGYDLEDNAEFAAYRGRPLDVVVTWPSRRTWKDFIEPVEAYTAYSGKPYTMVYGIPAIPENDGATMTDCAAGKYSSKWTTFGRTLADAGQGSSIIRLGWEMNGDWYAWGGKHASPATFAECWRQIVSTVRTVAPNLKFDWTVNRGSSAGMPGDAVYGAYPGDAYVDIIGIDSYDSWVDWNWALNGDQGLQDWLDFAVLHGKKLSVPEWGLFIEGEIDGVDHHGHGDNAEYVQHMYDFFVANKANIAYEAYFNEPARYIQDSLWNPIQMPVASARYKSLYRAPVETMTKIEDTATGTGVGKVQFSANWGKCTTTCPNAPDGNYLWTATPGSTATVRFSGHQLKWFGMKEPFSTIATVSIDGGAAVDVDPYSAIASTGTVELFASRILTEGTHTAVITMTNRRHPDSTGGSSITFDRAEVFSGAVPIVRSIEDTATGTGVGKVQFSANWAKCTTTCPNAPDGSYLWTATPGSTATVRFTGHRFTWFAMKEPFSTIATVSIDGGPPVDVDPYSPTADPKTVPVYTSDVLTEGAHTAVVTMTNRRHPDSGGGSSITFDRFDVAAYR